MGESDASSSHRSNPKRKATKTAKIPENIMERYSVQSLLNPHHPVEEDFHDDVVFVAMDVEWNTDDETTEYGIAVLDTRDLLDLNSGMRGQQWKSKIWSYHLWV